MQAGAFSELFPNTILAPFMLQEAGPTIPTIASPEVIARSSPYNDRIAAPLGRLSDVQIMRTSNTASIGD
jgi:hypothetical protein